MWTAILQAIPLLNKIADGIGSAYKGISASWARNKAQQQVETQQAVDQKVTTDAATGNVADLNAQLGFVPDKKP